jgi:hypothetical protein
MYSYKYTHPVLALILLLISFTMSTSVLALGECGMSCCIGGTTTSGVTLAKNFGLSVQYERMNMRTIRNGSEAISPDEVIDRFWMSGSSYAVPTDMTMEKLSFIMAKPINERWQVLGILPMVRNNMDMRRKMPNGMVMNMQMEEISGIGDITLMGLYTAYTDAPIRAKERLSLGFGIKTPTGDNNARNPMGNLVHAMMQAGTGSWDPIIMVNYMRAWYPLVTQINLLYHYSTESDLGYQFGDQVNLDLIARYQLDNYTNVGLALNAIYAGKDKDHDGLYSRPATSMVDNTENTGLTSYFITPSFQYKIPNTGGNIELKYQVPVYQDVNGYQQVTDSRWMATVSWAF